MACFEANERVPHGPARGFHVASPCCSVKFGMFSSRVEAATFGRGKSPSRGWATKLPMGGS